MSPLMKNLIVVASTVMLPLADLGNGKYAIKQGSK